VSRQETKSDNVKLSLIFSRVVIAAYPHIKSTQCKASPT